MTDGTTPWKVLTVDDDPEKLDEIERVLSTRMGDDKFVFTKETSFDNGMTLIGDSHFDLIILDVHENEHDPDPMAKPREEDQKGESLLQHLKSIRFVPVVFYTGYPGKVRPLESMVVRVVAKGGGVDDLRSAVRDVLRTKLPHLQRYIEEQSRSYIWNSLDVFLTSRNVSVESTDVSLLLARRLAATLSQRVVKEFLGMPLDKINPLEMYQYPPSDESCNPADIYRRKEDGSLWMVFTPACDFEQDKAENVLLAKVIPLTEHPLYTSWKSSSERMKSPGPEEGKTEIEKAMNNAKGDVKSLIKGKKGERYRFLPGTFFMPDAIVDFQNLVNHPRKLGNEFEIVCSLDSPYREEMLHLFSKYYGRIGTPDYDVAPVWEKIENAFDKSQ